MQEFKSTIKIYGIHPYAMQNLFTDSLKLMGITGISILVSRLKLRRDILKRRLFLRCVTYFLFNTFVWTMPFATVLTTYPSFCLYTFVSLRWRSLSSTIGYINFAFTMVIVFYLIWIQRFIYVRINLFRNEMIERKKKEKKEEEPNRPISQKNIEKKKVGKVSLKKKMI
jgi:hypothetical protein